MTYLSMTQEAVTHACANRIFPTELTKMRIDRIAKGGRTYVDTMTLSFAHEMNGCSLLKFLQHEYSNVFDRDVAHYRDIAHFRNVGI